MSRGERVYRAVLNLAIGLAVVYLIALLAGLVQPGFARAESGPHPSLPPQAGEGVNSSIQIPARSAIYRLRLTRLAGAQFGLDAPVARLAAQIHQESHWRADAQSPYAQGLAQFTPPTAEWLPNVCPEVGAPDPWDADWSLRAIACYDRWLYERVLALDECESWAFTLSAYNGGLGWVKRDQRLATAAGDDASRWFGHTEQHSSRAGWAFRENRAYVSRILLLIEPAYLDAGWPGAAACDPRGSQ